MLAAAQRPTPPLDRLTDALLPAPRPTTARSAALGAIAMCAAWAALHTLLATRRAKDAAVRTAGSRTADGWYRAAYNAQSVATFGALVWWCARRRGPVAWDLRGPVRVAARAVQAAGVAAFARAAFAVGVGPLSGVPNAWRALRGAAVPPMPEAQGPAEAAIGALDPRGPFVRRRHALNLAALAVTAAPPRASVARAAANAVLGAYLLVGARHSEALLRARHGAAYDAYAARTPRFV